MIAVAIAEEPALFDSTVRQPGRIFLDSIPNPTKDDWKGNEFWRIALPDMRSRYNEICAYCAQWIPHGTGAHSIDHFLPKRNNPGLAFEWSNFRYVSARFNSRKGRRSIFDPFLIQNGWLILDFRSFMIKRSNITDTLPEQSISLLDDTINFLGLNNDEDLVQERFCYYNNYINRHVTFDYLLRSAPFIAYEIDRQGLMLTD